MGSPLGIDAIALRPLFVALSLGAATVVLTIRAAASRRRPARVAPRSQSPRCATAISTLQAVYRRGDITHGDFEELSRRIACG